MSADRRPKGRVVSKKVRSCHLIHPQYRGRSSGWIYRDVAIGTLHIHLSHQGPCPASALPMPLSQLLKLILQGTEGLVHPIIRTMPLGATEVNYEPPFSWLLRSSAPQQQFHCMLDPGIWRRWRPHGIRSDQALPCSHILTSLLFPSCDITVCTNQYTTSRCLFRCMRVKRFYLYNYIIYYAGRS